MFKYPEFPPELEAQPFDDPDNPEWTEEMFARARGPEALSAAELAAFPRTLEWLRANGKSPAVRPPVKKLTSLRLDPDVLEHFKAGGPGWQSRINATLREAMARKRA